MNYMKIKPSVFCVGNLIFIFRNVKFQLIKSINLALKLNTTLFTVSRYL